LKIEFIISFMKIASRVWNF